MKPRVAPVRLTAEDREIWSYLGGSGKGWEFWMPSHYLASDRRDANLMLQAMRWRWIPGIGIRPEGFAVWGNGVPLQRIDAGGDLSADWYHT